MGLVTYPLSRFVARLKMTKTSNANGGFVVRGACLLHGVCRKCGPRPCYKPLVLTCSHTCKCVHIYVHLYIYIYTYMYRLCMYVRVGTYVYYTSKYEHIILDRHRYIYTSSYTKHIHTDMEVRLDKNLCTYYLTLMSLSFFTLIVLQGFGANPSNSLT